MKKIKLLGMIVSIMLLWFLGEPMEAYAKEYAYVEDESGDASWYEDSYINEEKKMDSAPDNLTSDDDIYIYAEPNDEVKAFCENLAGSLDGFYLYTQSTLTVGDGISSLYINNVRVDGGNLTLNADGFNVTSLNGTLTMNGNAGMLRLLGNGTYGSADTNKGAVTINGNVGEIVWHRDNGNAENYLYYSGDVTINGKVTETGKIIEYIYDETLQKYAFHQTGSIPTCDEGVFKITQGVLTENVVITSVQPDFSSYDINYDCYDWGIDDNFWIKYISQDGEAVSDEMCTQADIPEGASVTIHTTKLPVTFEYDLDSVHLSSGDITINGNVKNVYVEADEKNSNISISGNVENLTVYDFRSGQSNIYVGGEVKKGSYLIRRTEYAGDFECTAMQIMKDGIFCIDLFVKKETDSGKIEYLPIQDEQIKDALEDMGIGNEVVVDNQTIVKEALVNIQAAYENTIETISKMENFKAALDQIKVDIVVEGIDSVDVNPICGIEIDINSVYVDKETGNQYLDDDAYGKEQITELPMGKEITFTIKVPREYYDSKAKYTIVRHHIKEDGTDEIEVLKTTQNGDVLTFKSDKFSTFVIVEVDEKKDTSVIITDADGTPIKEDGILGNNGSYALEGLVAGTYTITVSNENYVSRTYTVEVGTEAVQLDIELHKTGDITGDNTINARDKKILYNHIAGTAELVDYDFAVGDVTGDNFLNARDKKMIYNHIAGTGSLWEEKIL